MARYWSCVVANRPDRYTSGDTRAVADADSRYDRRILASFSTRRDGRAVDGGGLENHCTGNRTGGSNPSPSATIRRQSLMANRLTVETDDCSHILSLVR